MRAPSRDAWTTFYESDTYAPIKPLRLEATHSTMALLDGTSTLLDHPTTQAYFAPFEPVAPPATQGRRSR